MSAGGTQVTSARVPFVIPLLLIAATATSILSTDLYAPSLPHLPEYFGTSESTVQLTMSLNLLAFAVGQLLFGPLSDRFGRRPVLLLGMTGFLIGSIGCALAQTIDGLVWARAFSGFMACSEAVIALAIIRDLYDEQGGVKILSIYEMVIALAPALGPTIGGYVFIWFGWRANFWIIAGLVAVVLLAIWIYLKESTVPDRDAMRWGRVTRGYVALLRHRLFLGHCFMLGGTLAGLFAFITAAPFIFIDRLGVATETYGIYYAMVVLSYFFACLFANRAVNRFSTRRILKAGIVLLVMGAILLIAVVQFGWESPSAITSAFSLFVFGMGLVWTTSPIEALANAPGGTGAASAMLGLMEMGGGALGAFAVGIFHDGTSWPLIWATAAGAAVALGAYLGMVRNGLRNSTA